MVERGNSVEFFIPHPEMEEKILFPGADSLHTESFHNRLVIEGFLEGNPGRIFTVREMMKELPFPVSAETCHDILRRSHLAKRLTSKNKTVKYVSEAQPLEPTFEGLDDGDELGKQARADFYELVRQRSLTIKKRYRAIMAF